MGLPYGATVLEHFRHPRNQRALARPTVAREGFNPLCGDRVRMEVELVGDQLRDVAFAANACAISTAAASLLTERLHGMSIATAWELTDDDMLAALGADVPAGRIGCATLPLRTLRDALASVRGATTADGRDATARPDPARE